MGGGGEGARKLTSRWRGDGAWRLSRAISSPRARRASERREEAAPVGFYAPHGTTQRGGIASASGRKITIGATSLAIFRAAIKYNLFLFLFFCPFLGAKSLCMRARAR